MIQLTDINKTYNNGITNQTDKFIHIKNDIIERIEKSLDHDASSDGLITI